MEFRRQPRRLRINLKTMLIICWSEVHDHIYTPPK